MDLPRDIPPEQSLIEYPCRFPIKVMGANVEGYVSAMAAVARAFDPGFDEATIEHRPSKAGNYLGVANILAPVLIRLFDAGLADLIQPNGEIILSGILDHQAESVIEAGQAKGLKRGETRQMKDWVAISMKK